MVLGISTYEEEPESEVTNPVKRIRWATRRVTGKAAKQKRQSIFNRLGSKRGHDRPERSSATGATIAEGDDLEDLEPRPARTVFFNIPLPDSARDEEGHPITHYKRNKIRTAKYTPLSFIPKNLWFQFHNIANVYFFFIIILQVSIACITCVNVL